VSDPRPTEIPIWLAGFHAPRAAEWQRRPLGTGFVRRDPSLDATRVRDLRQTVDRDAAVAAVPISLEEEVARAGPLAKLREEARTALPSAGSGRHRLGRVALGRSSPWGVGRR
jgi:hypothetical protein